MKGEKVMKVVVIGCGIVGASAAYSLVKSGVEVIMIDKEHEGNATSLVQALSVHGYQG